MDNNEQNELSYQRIQQLIKDQIDRIEHETDEDTASGAHEQSLTGGGIIAIIKRYWRRRCKNTNLLKQKND